MSYGVDDDVRETKYGAGIGNDDVITS